MVAATAAYVPRLTSHSAPAPALAWDASLGEDPLVDFDPGDDFLNFIMKVPGLSITQVTADAGPATSYTIQFSVLEGILTPAFHCLEVVALDEFIVLGFTGLVHLSHLIDAIIDEGDLTRPPPWTMFLNFSNKLELLRTKLVQMTAHGE